jgi:hypothetical protein
LPSAKSFRRFSKSLTLDWASDQLRVSKDHLGWWVSFLPSKTPGAPFQTN